MRPPPRIWEGKPIGATDLNRLGRNARQGQIIPGPGLVGSSTSRGTRLSLAQGLPRFRQVRTRMALSHALGSAALGETPAALTFDSIQHSDPYATFVSLASPTHTFLEDGVYLLTYQILVAFLNPTGESNLQMPDIRCAAWLTAGGTTIHESLSGGFLSVRQNLSNILYDPTPPGSGSGSGSGSGDFEPISPYASDTVAMDTLFGQALVPVIWTDGESPALKISPTTNPTIELMCKIELFPGQPTEHLDGPADAPAVVALNRSLSFIRQ